MLFVVLLHANGNGFVVPDVNYCTAWQSSGWGGFAVFRYFLCIPPSRPDLNAATSTGCIISAPLCRVAGKNKS